MKVKIFSATQVATLENLINDWIESFNKKAKKGIKEYIVIENQLQSQCKYAESDDRTNIVISIWYHIESMNLK